MNEQSIKNLSDQIMKGVVNTLTVEWVKNNDNKIDGMIEIMRAETKALFFGDEYKNEREAILSRTIHQGYVLSTVILNCVEKIRAL